MDKKKRKADNNNKSNKDNGAEDVVVSEEDIAQLLDLLSKEQLALLVKKAALAHTDTLSDLRQFADEDPASRKIFVRGLSWTTTTEILRRSFEKYGTVEDAVVISDRSTGKSKGFGFVTFKHRDACIRALKEPSKNIDGRMTVSNLSGAAAPTTSGLPTASQVPPESVSLRKIYVGNLPKSTQGATLLEFFSQYGEIEEGPLGFDRQTGKCKGFALFIYKTIESARKCLEEPVKKIGGHQVQCKLAEGNKANDEGPTLTSSALGYDITNPAALSYNPSLMQTNTSSLAQALLQQGGLSAYGLHGLDSLTARGSALLGTDSALQSRSLASLYGLSALPNLPTSGGSTYNPLLQSSLSSLQNAQGLGHPSLPRSSFY